MFVPFSELFYVIMNNFPKLVGSPCLIDPKNANKKFEQVMSDIPKIQCLPTLSLIGGIDHHGS